MRPNGIYSAFASLSVITSTDYLFRWKLPDSGTAHAEILRMFVRPHSLVNGLDEIVPISLGRLSGDTFSALAPPAEIQGQSDAASVASWEQVIIGSGFGGVWLTDAFKLSQGWVYEPHPSERRRFRSTTFQNEISVQVQLQDQINVRCGVVWAEYG